MENRLYLYLDRGVLKARQLESYEKLDNPLVWKDLHFKYTSSPLLMINWPIILPELTPETARSLLDLVGARYPFSPHKKELEAICPELVFSQETDEWIFFGGSFYPWHKGHQACLDLLPKDKVCFIIPDRNPLKELKSVEPVSTILELITKIKFSSNHYLAPTFLLNFQTNPTYNWIKKLKDENPDKKLSLLMGFDSLKNIGNWHKSEELLNLLSKVYVTSRLEDDDEREAVAGPIRKIAPNIEIVFLGRHSFEAESSTEIRKVTETKK